MRRKVAVSGTKKRKKAAPRRKTTTRRRRRISGIGSVDIQGIAMKVAGLGVGAIAARELNTIIQKSVPSITPTIVGLIQIGAGVVLPMLVKGNKFVADMGDGMIAFGVQVEAVQLGIISGVGSAPGMMSYRVNGTNRLQPVNGTSRLQPVNGTARLQPVNGVSRRRPERCV